MILNKFVHRRMITFQSCPALPAPQLALSFPPIIMLWTHNYPQQAAHWQGPSKPPLLTSLHCAPHRRRPPSLAHLPQTGTPANPMFSVCYKLTVS